MFVEALIGLSVIGFIVLKYILPNPIKLNLDGSHVLITGGSSGIGKALAEEAFRAGAKVTLLARDLEKLMQTKSYLLEKCRRSDQNDVQVFSIDISKDYEKVNDVQVFSIDISKDYEKVNDVMEKSQITFGPLDILINCAGFAVAGKLEDIQIDSFKKLMELNYFGSLYCTRAVIGGMKKRKRGRVVFISSQAGQLGLFGYSGYSASKFALKGLAEALQMEVSAHNVRVCVAYPPDTKTPGYDEEIKSKPLETAIISAESGFFKAADVAKSIMKGVLSGKFNIHIGFEGFFLSTLTAGMSPATQLSEAMIQILTMGFLRIISIAYLFKFNKIVAQCNR